MIVQPDEVGDPTDSVRFCTDTSLEASTGASDGLGGNTTLDDGTDDPLMRLLVRRAGWAWVVVELSS